jgi:Tfp pilus assembly protein PilZ
MGKLSKQIKKYNENVSKLIEIILKLKYDQQERLLKYAESMLFEDKRGTTRKSCTVPVTFASQNKIFTDLIKDISKGGLFIETEKALSIGEKIIMSFNIDGFDRPLKIEGEVVRANQSGVGVEYTQISPYLVEMIGKLVERMRG